MIGSKNYLKAIFYKTVFGILIQNNPWFWEEAGEEYEEYYFNKLPDFLKQN